MKKVALWICVLFGGVIILSSCRSQKQACAAYSKVEQAPSAKLPS